MASCPCLHPTTMLQAGKSYLGDDCCRRAILRCGNENWNRTRKALSQRPLQAGYSSMRQRRIESDAEPRSRHGRCMRAILYRHNDCAASISKSKPEIKNRCTKEGVNREKPASIPKFGPEIKNRCTQEGLNREKLASIPKFGPEIKNRCRPGLRRRNHFPLQQRKLESGAADRCHNEN